ncbi:hypothetical protein [Saccharopolyspora griseoalba]|uniref:Uncharacterized protein n=1 Tax=Saccharopolyspora griseoalba TaxID=1431848 RepID=A0ABW2LQ00_9PSEU
MLATQVNIRMAAAHFAEIQRMAADNPTAPTANNQKNALPIRPKSPALSPRSWRICCEANPTAALSAKFRVKKAKSRMTTPHALRSRWGSGGDATGVPISADAM